MLRKKIGRGRVAQALAILNFRVPHSLRVMQRVRSSVLHASQVLDLHRLSRLQCAHTLLT